ncbi:MAG TPA: hypothetical protein VNN07_17700 [Candidatus Tectomicrobia bacterium]|nr:hypothetical protein [Candidatus Tectomicrobia bacterium]
MTKLLGPALAVMLALSACSTAPVRPVEVDMPAEERHFVVMSRGGTTLP